MSNIDRGLKEVKKNRITVVALLTVWIIISSLILPKLMLVIMLITTVFLMLVFYLSYSFTIKQFEKEVEIFKKQMKYLESKLGNFEEDDVFKMSYGYDVLTKNGLYSIFIKNNEITSIVKSGDLI